VDGHGRISRFHPGHAGLTRVEALGQGPLRQDLGHSAVAQTPAPHDFGVHKGGLFRSQLQTWTGLLQRYQHLDDARTLGQWFQRLAHHRAEAPGRRAASC